MTETRAEKAQRLVDEGRVNIIEQGQHVIEARVQGDHSFYHTHVYANGHYFCDCAWTQYNTDRDDLCAHALAVKLAASLGSPLG